MCDDVSSHLIGKEPQKTLVFRERTSEKNVCQDHLLDQDNIQDKLIFLHKMCALVIRYNWLFLRPCLSNRIQLRIFSPLHLAIKQLFLKQFYLRLCQTSLTKTAILPLRIHQLPLWSAGWPVRVWCDFAESELTLLNTGVTREHKQPNHSCQRWNSSVLVLRGKIAVFVKGVWRLWRELITASTPHRKRPVWGKGRVVKMF